MRKTIYRHTALILALAGLLNTGCSTLWFEPEPLNEPLAIFDDLWQRFDASYGPFAARGVDWQAQRGRFRPALEGGATDSVLYDALTGMLATLDDGHVNLTVPGRNIFRSNRFFRERIGWDRFDLGLIKNRYIPQHTEGPEESYLYGEMAGLLYIHFPWVGENFLEINSILDRYPQVNGLILDLRHNSGGDFTYCFSEMGRFTQQRRFVFTSRTKNGPGRQDFTPWYDWHIEPKGSYFDKPIVVLADRFTISAGERALMAFLTLPNVSFIGDTTNGAHATMIGMELANGWFYTLPTQEIKLFDGKSYEGIGLIPKEVVINRRDELDAGTDRVLERAIELLR